MNPDIHGISIILEKLLWMMILDIHEIDIIPEKPHESKGKNSRVCIC